MIYHNIIEGRFLDRPNRFIGQVDMGDDILTVHVKNTGRCQELLLPGAPVVLAQADNPNRKTKYDLIAVKKEGIGWVNIDSQAPNEIVWEWLTRQSFNYIRREYAYGGSRMDFYMEKGNQRYLLEVKGCTLEMDGVGYFPDAPTARGVKHIRELIKAQAQGYGCAIAFVIQMNGVKEVRPNVATHPEFGAAISEAKQAGVQVLHLPCTVAKDEIRIRRNRLREKALWQ